MASLSHYYGRAKGSLMGISPHAIKELGGEWAIAAATGVAIAAMAKGAGGYDKKIGGTNVPIDALAAVAAGIAGLSTRSPELQTASIAAVGAAAARISAKQVFKISGEIEDWAETENQLGYGYGSDHLLGAYGADINTDRLVAFARTL